MISPRKSELKERKLHYDEVYKKKRLKEVKNKFFKYNVQVNVNIPSFTYFFKNPEDYLEKIEDYYIYLPRGNNREYYKRIYLNFRKMAGKFIKGKNWLITPQIKDDKLEKIEYLTKINKKIIKRELKDYFYEEDIEC